LQVLTTNGDLYQNGAFVGHTHLVLSPIPFTNYCVGAYVLDTPGYDPTRALVVPTPSPTGDILTIDYIPTNLSASGVPASPPTTVQGALQLFDAAVHSLAVWLREPSNLVAVILAAESGGVLGIVDVAMQSVAKDYLANKLGTTSGTLSLIQRMEAAALSTNTNLMDNLGRLLLSPVLRNMLSNDISQFSSALYNNVLSLSEQQSIPPPPSGGSGGGGSNGQPLPWSDPGSGDPGAPEQEIGAGGGILTVIFEFF
jgi:hypothetical protein